MTAVNAEALAPREGKTVVVVVRDNKAAVVPVSAGNKIGDLTAITGDVKTGEKAVPKPAADLQDGALVKLAPK